MLSAACAASLICGVLPTAAVLSQSGMNKYGYPEKHAPKPTTADITVQDLMTRIYIFADDSMQGRQAGRIGNQKGTDYIARELKRLGIEPGGDNGGYFQTLPYMQRKFTNKSMMVVGEKALRFNDDFVPVPGAVAPKPINNVGVIFGGVSGDTSTYITAEQASGKLVILAAPRAVAAAGGAPRGGPGGGFGGGGAAMARFAGAAAVATVNLDAVAPAARGMINEPAATFAAADAKRTVAAGDVVISRAGMVGVVRNGELISGRLPSGMTAAMAKTYTDSIARADSIAAAGRAARGPVGGPNSAPSGPVQQIRLTSSAASMLLGAPIANAKSGDMGGTVTAQLDYMARPTDWGRNVVGIIRGSDPALRGQFVAIGAHNDHVGFRAAGPIDHDSARAMASERLRLQMASGDLRALDADQAAGVKANVDSLRKIRPARPDSINNGADDDGSGSMAILEIAEAIQRMPVKPKRSVVFVWHTAEESGMHGSRHFASNPSVPVDSIVTAINVDMVGRGRAEDVIGGGDTYTGVLGANRLSGDLGRMVDEVNGRRKTPIKLDSRFDDPTIGTTVNGVVSWPGYQNLYGRSDHTRYAEKCIPIVFFFTGLHGDYHQVTDEAQYIDYPHYATITGYIRDLLLEVGNRSTRPSLDAMCVRR